MSEQQFDHQIIENSTTEQPILGTPRMEQSNVERPLGHLVKEQPVSTGPRALDIILFVFGIIADVILLRTSLIGVLTFGIVQFIATIVAANYTETTSMSSFFSYSLPMILEMLCFMFAFVMSIILGIKMVNNLVKHKSNKIPVIWIVSLVVLIIGLLVIQVYGLG